MLVYLVTNKINGKIYVGKHEGASATRRWYFHCYYALVAKSELPFHRAIRKYGVDSFVVSVLAHASTSDELNELEKFYIKQMNAQQKEIGYNILAGGDGSLGFKWTPEMKGRLRAKRMGENNPFFGKHHTAEAREKMGAANAGIPKTPEHRAKIFEASSGENNAMFGKVSFFRGQIHSEETKERISEAQLASYSTNPSRIEQVSEEMKKNWADPEISAKMLKGLEKARLTSPVGKVGYRQTEENKKKIGDANRGRVLTLEHKQKLSDKLKGRNHTPEAKAKMSEALRKSWAARKAAKEAS